MSNLLRRTASVLLATVIVALVVYSVIQLGSRAFADPAEIASSAGAATTRTQAAHGTTTTSLKYTTSTNQSTSTNLVCPRTGCTASSCHATDPSAPGGRR